MWNAAPSTPRQIIENMPKVELHLHLEGSLEPEMMFSFAQRNGIQIPFKSVEDVKAAYKFKNLQEFLDIYYQGMNVLRTEQDFYDLTMAYLTKMNEQNVRHVEVFFDPQGHTERGVAFDTVISGIDRALKDGEAKFGISNKLIMCFLRHLSEESAEATLNEALRHADKIWGVGLDSSEVGNPPAKFRNVFERADQEGFYLVAHAGEEGPPDYIWEALDVLNVDRIDHGNRCLEDFYLMLRLRDAEMGLTVCPLSNLELCGVTDMREHPIQQMLDFSLKASVNSDDPAYFGGYMTENYMAVYEALNLSLEEVYQLARNAIDTSFASEERKTELRYQLEAYAMLNGMRGPLPQPPGAEPIFY